MPQRDDKPLRPQGRLQQRLQGARHPDIQRRRGPGGCTRMDTAMVYAQLPTLAPAVFLELERGLREAGGQTTGPRRPTLTTQPVRRTILARNSTFQPCTCSANCLMLSIALFDDSSRCPLQMQAPTAACSRPLTRASSTTTRTRLAAAQSAGRPSAGGSRS